MSCVGCRKIKKCADARKVDGCSLYIDKNAVRTCYMCGINRGIEEHHCLSGSNRKMSDKYGLTVDLCVYCHKDGWLAVHKNYDSKVAVIRKAQKCFLDRGHTMEEWMELFGKNYL